MRNLLLIVALAVLLLLPQVVFGATSFNTDPQDYPTLEVSNATQNPGCTTCWSSSVNASPGDILAFEVYYHNTGSETAQDTRIRVSLPSGSLTTAGIGSSLSAANAVAVGNTVTVNFTSSQTLAFVPGSVRWYPNQTTRGGGGSASLPFGQDGSEVVGSGLRIGDVTPGWATAGLLVFRAQVSQSGSPPPPAPSAGPPTAITSAATAITITSANLRARITPNGADTSVWFEYGKTALLEQTSTGLLVGGGSAPTDIAIFVSGLEASTTYQYQVLVRNSYGENHGSVLTFTTLTESPPPPPPSPPPPPPSPLPVQPAGAPSATTTPATPVTRDSVNLRARIDPNGADTSVWFEYGTTASLGLNSTAQVFGGGTAPLDTAIFVGGLRPNTAYQYRVAVQNSYGQSRGAILSFTTLSDSGTPTNGTPSASTQPATSVGQTSAVLQGMVNPNGLETNAWFEYGETPDLGTMTAVLGTGSGSSFVAVSHSLSSLAPSRTYFFRVAAQNSQGIWQGGILTFVTPGVVSGSTGSAPSVLTEAASGIGATFATFHGTVNPNGLFTETWFEYGRTISSLDSRIGTQFVGSGNSGIPVSFVLAGLDPRTTYYYRVGARNDRGTVFGTVVDFTTTGTPSVTPHTPPSAITASATGITTATARLQSSVNPNGDPTTAWFEWGGSATTLTNRTPADRLGGGTSFFSYSAPLANLFPSTRYFFRVAAQNSFGNQFGNTLSFTTANPSAPAPAPLPRPSPPPIRSGTTPPATPVPRVSVSSGATIAITPGLEAETVAAPGEELNLRIRYRNDGPGSIRETALKIFLPSDVTFRRATLDPAAVSPEMLLFHPAALEAGQEQELTATVRVSESAADGTELPFRVTLDYTDSAERFQMTESNLTVLVKHRSDTGGLAASFLGLGGMLGSVFTWIAGAALMVGAYLVGRLRAARRIIS